MKVQSIQNNSTIPQASSQMARWSNISFGKIKVQDGLFEDQNNRAIYTYISEKLNEIDPSDKNNRSFVKRAEDYGYNILFSQDKKTDGVRIDVLPAMAEQKISAWNRIPTNELTHVGTYTEPEQFSIDHFVQKYKPQEKVTKDLCYSALEITGAILLATALFTGIANRQDIKPQKMNNVENVVKTDSIKPLLKDTLQLSKKAIK